MDEDDIGSFAVASINVLLQHQGFLVVEVLLDDERRMTLTMDLDVVQKLNADIARGEPQAS